MDRELGGKTLAIISNQVAGNFKCGKHNNACLGSIQNYPPRTIPYNNILCSYKYFQITSMD